MKSSSSFGDGFGLLPSNQIHMSEAIGKTGFAARELVGFIGRPEVESDWQSRRSMYEVKPLDERKRMEFM